MKKPVLVLALAALSIPLMGASTPAEAGVRWHAGVDFRVGGLDFTIGYNAPRYYGSGFRPTFFYRTRAPLRYDGFRCGSACYIRDSYHYHDRACPLVRRHFSVHRFDPFNAWRYVDYGYGYGYGYGYRHHDERRWYRDRYRYERDRRYRSDHRRYAPDRRRYAYPRYDDDFDSDSDSGRRRGRRRD